MSASNCFILGGGVTGLAAGYASRHPVYEARQAPGGICASYYMAPGGTKRYAARPSGVETYRFEIGGGHWIFGGDPAIKRFLRQLIPMRSYRRQSAVYLPDYDSYVPYPLQNHLRYLSNGMAADALADLLRTPNRPVRTMRDWLQCHFGETLCDLFFGSFHELYTAGLWCEIAPQDVYKSPVNVEAVVRGAMGAVDDVGYNVEFMYPEGGLDELMRRLATRCDVRYGKRAIAVDVKEKTVVFDDGTQQSYEVLISTLPLNKMLAMADLQTDARPDPHTSVLVLNIGAVRGARCPDDHWIYVPRSEAGFHRVGLYSNVDAGFLPQGQTVKRERVSLYVERAYPGSEEPSQSEKAAYTEAVVRELKAWGYIERAEVVDPTWIDVAYTWAWPDSSWRAEALEMLEAYDILMVGRYGRWTFQGIADSIRDGLFVGNTTAL